MNLWIRLYREALHDPKIVTLSDRQHRAWINCLLIAGEDGMLPTMRDIAVHLRMSAQDAEQLIGELIDAELIDPAIVNGVRSYRLHGWEKRQYVSDSSAERTRKYRQRKRDETSHGRHSDDVVTPPDTDTEGVSINNNPSTVDRAREAGIENSDFGGVSVDARRKVAVLLGVGNPDPIVAVYAAWPKRGHIRDRDAHFIASAPAIFERLPKALRKACQPLASPPAEPLPPVKASPQLRAKLKGKAR